MSAGHPISSNSRVKGLFDGYTGRHEKNAFDELKYQSQQETWKWPNFENPLHGCGKIGTWLRIANRSDRN